MQILHLGLNFIQRHPNYILGILKQPYMWVLHLRLGLHLKLLKSFMGYFEMNLNMAIAFRARYSYNFAIHAHVLTFTK